MALVNVALAMLSFNAGDIVSAVIAKASIAKNVTALGQINRDRVGSGDQINAVGGLQYANRCKQNCEAVCQDYGTTLQVDDDSNYAVCGYRGTEAKREVPLCGYSSSYAAFECCGLKPGLGPTMADCKYEDTCDDKNTACLCVCNLKS